MPIATRYSYNLEVITLSFRDSTFECDQLAGYTYVSLFLLLVHNFPSLVPRLKTEPKWSDNIATWPIWFALTNWKLLVLSIELFTSFYFRDFTSLFFIQSRDIVASWHCGIVTLWHRDIVVFWFCGIVASWHFDILHHNVVHMYLDFPSSSIDKVTVAPIALIQQTRSYLTTPFICSSSNFVLLL